MRKNEALIAAVCRPFCRYYKKDRNEDLLCRGAVIVERLILSGRSIALDRKKKDRYQAEPSIKGQAVNALCSACAFRRDDCDFAQDGTSQPCGGFILLAGLLGDGVITIEDLQ